jgi:DNA-binding MurR/RpiR family transcriptional regulator
MDTSVYYSIKSKYKILSKKEKLIANYIIDKPLDPISTSISKLSSKVGVSEPTMVRFVRKLGFQNYQEFRGFISMCG